jgi:hypothetical protein
MFFGFRARAGGAAGIVPQARREVDLHGCDILVGWAQGRAKGGKRQGDVERKESQNQWRETHMRNRHVGHSSYCSTSAPPAVVGLTDPIACDLSRIEWYHFRI